MEEGICIDILNHTGYCPRATRVGFFVAGATVVQVLDLGWAEQNQGDPLGAGGRGSGEGQSGGYAAGDVRDDHPGPIPPPIE